jgi:RNA polymerase sigma-70 factor (ECF subfamily)
VAERHAERDALQKVMMLCPLAHRQVLALRYYHDLSLEEIAETLGCTLTAAKVRLHRARNVFRRNYVATFGTESPNAYKWEEPDVTRSIR